MTTASRLILILLAVILTGCAEAPPDHEAIRTDQDPWERVGTVIAKK